MELACEEGWSRFHQWILEQQFGHLATITLAMEDATSSDTPEPTEAQYLGYFAYLWTGQGRHGANRLWNVYTLLNNSSKMRYGRGLEWTTVRQALRQYKREEEEQRRQEIPVFYHNGIAHYWNIH